MSVNENTVLAFEEEAGARGGDTHCIIMTKEIFRGFFLSFFLNRGGVLLVSLFKIIILAVVRRMDF